MQVIFTQILSTKPFLLCVSLKMHIFPFCKLKKVIKKQKHLKNPVPPPKKNLPSNIPPPTKNSAPTPGKNPHHLPPPPTKNNIKTFIEILCGWVNKIFSCVKKT